MLMAKQLKIDGFLAHVAFTLFGCVYFHIAVVVDSFHICVLRAFRLRDDQMIQMHRKDANFFHMQLPYAAF